MRMKKRPDTKGPRPVRIERILCLTLGACLLIAALVLGAIGISRVRVSDRGQRIISGVEFVRRASVDAEAAEEYDEDYTVCRVEYVEKNGERICAIEYTYEEFRALPVDHSFEGVICISLADGAYAAFPTMPEQSVLRDALADARTDAASGFFNGGLALLLTAIGFFIMAYFGGFFSLYEKIWFLGILVLAAIFAILFPEEGCNGVSGIAIMALYLADTFLNILCELLISKQSKWNFIVSVFVEITEILICVVLAYRFATMATTLFFWLPIDIISFINWHRHPDREDDELTEVRRLRGWQEALVLAGIAVWTLGIGWLLTYLDFGTELFGGNRTLEIAVCYIDACASAVGIANGLFIFFRIREQWIAWYACSILEAVINILSGQYVLLVLKFGYLTNTTYGYMKWTKYIQEREKRPA